MLTSRHGGAVVSCLPAGNPALCSQVTGGKGRFEIRLKLEHVIAAAAIVAFGGLLAVGLKLLGGPPTAISPILDAAEGSAPLPGGTLPATFTPEATLLAGEGLISTFPAPASLAPLVASPPIVLPPAGATVAPTVPPAIQATADIAPTAILQQTATVPLNVTPPATAFIPPTATAIVPPQATATIPPSATSTPALPGSHDVTVCHGAETGDGHTHGICPADLPPGPIRAFVEANPLFAAVGHPWHSSMTENVFPYPAGKHEGHINLYYQFSECMQSSNVLETPDASCLRALYVQVHSMRIAEELYLGHTEAADGQAHSIRFVAEVGDQETFESEGVVAGGQISVYGELHQSYKKEGCEAFTQGVRFPDPYSVYSGGDETSGQVPYVAVRQGGNDPFATFFWNSQTNQVIQNLVYEPDVNRLIEIAWSEIPWERVSSDPVLCGLPEFDEVLCPASAAGCRNTEFSFWTLKLNLEDYPRPFNGYVDRSGVHAPACTEPGHDCIPLHIDAGVEPGQNVFHNRPVVGLEDDPFVLDLSEPGLVMPSGDG
ncbi:MAG: hypothetical protein ACRDHL_05470 [Candidatus Promineifilaceae bacterium]